MSDELNVFAIRDIYLSNDPSDFSPHLGMSTSLSANMELTVCQEVPLLPYFNHRGNGHLH